MRFLLDANLPRSSADILRHFGHEAIDVRAIGMGGAEDKDIAVHTRANQLTIVTRDFDFSDVRNYPPGNYAGIIVLELPDNAVAADVIKVLESFCLNLSCSPTSMVD